MNFTGPATVHDIVLAFKPASYSNCIVLVQLHCIIYTDLGIKAAL